MDKTDIHAYVHKQRTDRQKEELANQKSAKVDAIIFRQSYDTIYYLGKNILCSVETFS